MKNTRFLFSALIICLLTGATNLIAQPLVYPLELGQRQQIEQKLLAAGELHSVWPYTGTMASDTLLYADIKPLPGKFSASWVGRKLLSESLIRVSEKQFTLSLDPLANFSVGNQPDASRGTWVNTRGFRAQGNIGSKFSYYTAFYESQAVFATWTDSITRALAVVPGQAFIKNFKNKGFDYAFSEGHITWQPSDWFTFRFGHGKNFFGDGYRSLLLSDAAFNNPYLMIRTKIWHLHYTNLYAQFQDLRKPAGADSWTPWLKKYATIHHLSWNVNRWFNISVYEAIVWKAADSTGQRGFDVNYLNPVIFYRPVEFSLSSPDNALLGGSMRFTIRRSIMLYAQLMLDEFSLEHVRSGDGWWANKHGFQLGAKAYNAFRVNNLTLQAEYNHVRPYTYAHYEPLQNYAHYNQPLAHPQGANFRELDLLASYRLGRWLFSYKMVACTYGADTAGLNYGRNVYKPYSTYVNEFGNKIGQGLKTNLLMHEIKAGWLVNPATNLQLNAGVTLRSESSTRCDFKGSEIWIGLRSALFNTYYDF